MNGYKTGGDWTDITSIGRNEVVFEGRHKAYGAYYIRQRYSNALYFSMLSATAFVAFCTLIPYAFRNINPAEAVKKTDVTVTPIDVVVHKKTVEPPVTHPAIKPPKPPIFTKAPPVVTHQTVDSLKPIKYDEHTVVYNGNPANTDSPSTIEPQPDIGGPIETEPVKEKPLLWVAEMPKFREGNIEEYLRSKINYPVEESQLGIQGTVHVSFIIEKDGSVSNVTLDMGVPGGPGINKEALRVISEMPAWTPGKQDGHPVRVQFRIPIHFKLQ